MNRNLNTIKKDTTNANIAPKASQRKKFWRITCWWPMPMSWVEALVVEHAQKHSRWSLCLNYTRHNVQSKETSIFVQIVAKSLKRHLYWKAIECLFTCKPFRCIFFLLRLVLLILFIISMFSIHDFNFVSFLSLSIRSERFSCDICKRSFASKGSLVYHVLNLHAKTRNYSCDLCEASYSYHSSLRDHKSEWSDKFMTIFYAAQVYYYGVVVFFIIPSTFGRVFDQILMVRLGWISIVWGKKKKKIRNFLGQKFFQCIKINIITPDCTFQNVDENLKKCGKWSFFLIFWRFDLLSLMSSFSSHFCLFFLQC